jgi:arylsulfatase
LDNLVLCGGCFARTYSTMPIYIPAQAALSTGMCQSSPGCIGYVDGVPWNFPFVLVGESYHFRQPR